MRGFLRVLGVALFGVAPFAHTQAPPPSAQAATPATPATLTLDDAIRRAESNEPAFATAFAESRATALERKDARAALLLMIDRARSDPSVRVFRVTVSPDNAASLGLVAQLPFVEVGEQWDDEDGLETIFQVDANPSQ